MPRLAWNQAGEKFYEAGVDRGVFYQDVFGLGVPWNGLISVGENPVGGESEPLYYDGRKYLDWMGGEDFQAMVEAYAYPKEFELCDGTAEIAPGLSATQQLRRSFGLSYRIGLGNDLSDEAGYKLHLVYNASVPPTSRSAKTRGASPEPGTFQWTINTVPVSIEGFKPSAHLVFDSTRSDPYFMEVLSQILYGSSTTEARLPLPDELIELVTTFDPAIIVPHILTGLHDLVLGLGDLSKTGIEGLYWKLPESRLTESPTPGLFELEE